MNFYLVFAQNGNFAQSYTSTEFDASVSGTTLTVTPKAATSSAVTLTVKEGNGDKTTTVSVKVLIVYSINYDLNGGTVSNNPISYTIESSTITLNNPSKSEYTFVGWSDDNTILLSKQGSEIPNNGNVYYGPYYKVNAGYYKVDIYGTNLDKATFNAYEYNTSNVKLCDKQVLSSTHAVLIIQATSNLTTSGLEITVSMGSGSTVTKEEIRDINTTVTIPKGSTGDKYYTACWKNIDYSITYTLNGGSASNPTSYTQITPTITLNNPTRSGYTFVGWAGSNDLSSGLESYTTSNPYTCAARDHILGNEFNVSVGTVYRVYVTAKRTAGSLVMNGGIYYTEQSSGHGYDGHQTGSFIPCETLSNGYQIYYKDVTVPSDKTKGKLYIQLEQSSGSYTTSWSIADCHVVARDVSATIPMGSTGNKTYIAYWRDTNLGNYSISLGSPVYHKTLSSAVSTCSANGTVTALNSTSETDSFTINKNLTINTNGKTLTRTAGTLTVSGGTTTISGNGTITETGTANLFNVTGGTFKTANTPTLRSTASTINMSGASVLNLAGGTVTSSTGTWTTGTIQDTSSRIKIHNKHYNK